MLKVLTDEELVVNTKFAALEESMANNASWTGAQGTLERCFGVEKIKDLTTDQGF